MCIRDRYYIRAVDSLWQGIDHVLAAPKNKGEYFLTDAFQWMIEHGKRIYTAEVGGWYDCGAVGTLLETNEILLRKGAARRREFPGVTIHDPVYIEDDVAMSNATIGPNVTLGKGSRVEGSTLTDTIVGSKGTIRHSQLHNSLIGDEVIIEGLKGELTVSDHSEIRGS